MGFVWLVGFIATIPTANYLIQHIGVTCVPNGPCLVPVLPGLLAPSGVLMIGLALVLRDAVHSTLGWRWSVLGIVCGAALSALLAPASLVIASAVAFLFSELADLSVYAPMRKNRPVQAVLFSGVVGAVVDSVLFLLIAFGSLEFVAGQVVGKIWMSVIAALILKTMHTNRAERPTST
jgi:queuosine precursor transporter